MTEAQIQELVARTVQAALTAAETARKAEEAARETARLVEVGRAAEAARAQGTPTGTPPAAAGTDGNSEVAILRARAEAAEAETRAAQARARAAELVAAAGGTSGAGNRAADRSTPAPADAGAATPAKNPAARNIPRPVPGPNGVDLREICPNAIRAVGRSFGQLQLDARTVLEADGMTAIAPLAQAEGSAPRLAELCIANELLLSSNRGAARALASSFGPLAADRARADRTVEPGWDDRQGLEDLLHEVLRAGASDGLIKSKEVEATWA